MVREGIRMKLRYYIIIICIYICVFIYDIRHFNLHDFILILCWDEQATDHTRNLTSSNFLNFRKLNLFIYLNSSWLVDTQLYAENFNDIWHHKDTCKYELDSINTSVSRLFIRVSFDFQPM